MNPTQRYFTLAEAESLIPKLERLMSEARILKTRAETKARQGATTESPVEAALAQGQVDFLITQIDECLRGIIEMGVVPKDLDNGLVDFPSRWDGREVYLCWKLGEGHISHWHGLTEGFQGRKPLENLSTYTNL